MRTKAMKIEPLRRIDYPTHTDAGRWKRKFMRFLPGGVDLTGSSPIDPYPAQSVDPPLTSNVHVHFAILLLYT
jgi:hypothetical protein